MILQGILGFPEDEIWQDYQFSSAKSGFSPKEGSKCLQTFSEFLKGFDQYDGATLDERIRKYVIDLGFTEADIEKIRTILLEETFSAALASEGRVDAAKCAAETSAVGGLSCVKGGVSKAEYLDLVEAAVSAYPEDHVAERSEISPDDRREESPKAMSIRGAERSEGIARRAEQAAQRCTAEKRRSPF